MKIPQEEEGLPLGKVVAVGVSALLVFAVATFWAARILLANTGSLRQGGPPAPQIGRSEIGIVDQLLFDGLEGPAQINAAKTRWLRSYGWVDRERGVIHIPIERAMELVLEGAAMPGEQHPEER